MTAPPRRSRCAGTPAYDVVVGRGMLRPRRRRARPSGAQGARRAPADAGRAAAHCASALADRREVLLAEIPDAEEGKRVEVAAFCWQVLGQADFTRTDAVVGFGGGAVTDLAGFVAATWLRGVAGRAGADDGARHGRRRRRRQDRHQHREGKNLVGAFHAPRAVLCDLSLLDSLPRNEASPGSPRSSRPVSSATPRSST